jgi:hypothetical protein
MTGTNTDQTALPAEVELTEAKARFATWIKSVREQAGLSLDAVAYETKINKTHLVSLESGDLDALPGKVFGRGFVKCVTRLLKTDGAEGLKLYDACWDSVIITQPNDVEEDSSEVHKTKSVRARIAEPINTASPVTQRLFGGGFSAVGEKPRLPSATAKLGQSGVSFNVPSRILRSFISPYTRLWLLVGVMSLFVALVFGRWAASHWHKERLRERSTAELSAPELKVSDETHTGSITRGESQLSSQTNAPVEVPGIKSESIGNAAIPILTKNVGANKTQVLAKNEDAALYMPSETVAAFEQVLEINVLNPVEIRLTLDGKTQDNTWFKPDTYRFTFNKLAELYILDASEVDVVYNGRSLGVLGSKGRKRRIFLQAKAAESDFPQ